MIAIEIQFYINSM